MPETRARTSPDSDGCCVAYLHRWLQGVGFGMTLGLVALSFIPGTAAMRFYYDRSVPPPALPSSKKHRLNRLPGGTHLLFLFRYLTPDDDDIEGVASARSTELVTTGLAPSAIKSQDSVENPVIGAAGAGPQEEDTPEEIVA